MSQDKRQKRDLHALNQDGMVLCNPRDKRVPEGREEHSAPRERHRPTRLSTHC